MSQFYLPSTSPTNTPASPRDLSSDDEDTLPYPTELPRRDFLAADFDPSRYLSTLRNRHQTLEDLRSDLRARSQLLTKELLDLVNGNYEEFLALGGDLKGGEEKVEEVRLGLLGFQREIETLRREVRVRNEEATTLVNDRKNVRKDVVFGRALLEVVEKIGELEDDLHLDVDQDEDKTSEDEEDEAEWVLVDGIPVGKLQKRVRQYQLIEHTIQRLDPQHPFLLAQASRLQAIRKTILIDLGTALRQAKAAKASDAVLPLIALFGDLDAQPESIMILKAT